MEKNIFLKSVINRIILDRKNQITYFDIAIEKLNIKTISQHNNILANVKKHYRYL